MTEQEWREYLTERMRKLLWNHAAQAAESGKATIINTTDGDA